MDLKSNLIAFYTIIYDEFRRTMRIWVQTIVPAAVTTLLYFLIFGHLIGRRIGIMSGLSYVDFIAPGLIMMSMLTSSFNAVAGNVYSAKWTRIIEEILVSPMSVVNITAAYLCSGALRGMIIGVVVTIVAAFFVHFQIQHVIYMLFIAVLSCSIFSLFGIINGLLAKNFDQISVIPTFIITPLTYLGGVFYSLNILPSFWQKVAFFNPIIYIISTFRYAFYGQADTNIIVATGLMVVMFLILFAATTWMFKVRKGISR